MIPPMTIKGVPHWEARFPEYVHKYYESFPKFMDIVWEHLGLPKPTLAQYEVAHYLQYGFDSVAYGNLSDEQKVLEEFKVRTSIIRAFRSLGKSYVTAAYTIWRLMRQPRNEKVMVISATGSKAKEFVAQVKSITASMPLVTWLLAGARDQGAVRRDQADRFDVTYSSIAQSYSLKAVGIEGQITGSRATLLIADDIEEEGNSRTEEARARILRAIDNDFEAIVQTDVKGSIIFLGTPRTEESLYNVLVKSREYACLTIPALYPIEDKRENYKMLKDDGSKTDLLAPYLQKRYDDGLLKEDEATDTRYATGDLIGMRRKSAASFALNYMLDTTLSDAERYPLKLRDLMVLQVANDKAPISVSWGRDSQKKNFINDVPNMGFTGDYLLRPLFLDNEWRQFEESIVFVDPAGRGADEMAWSVLRCLNGNFYLVHVGGYSGDEPREGMVQIARDALRFGVHTILVEPNFGQGMFLAAMQPIVNKVYPGGCLVKESEWAKGQKETRIIDTLEPVMTSHRLIISEEVVRADIRNEQKFSLLYQMTRLTRDRGCLRHDDRIDSLAGGIAYFLTHMSISTDELVDAMKEAEAEEYWQSWLSYMENPHGDGNLRTADGSTVYTSRW